MKSFQKGFVKLEYGKNEINLKTTNCAINIILFRLAFNPSIRLGNKIEQHDEPNIVRVLYVVCKDDITNGEFQSDDSINNKLENAKNRIDLGKSSWRGIMDVYLIKMLSFSIF